MFSTKLEHVSFSLSSKKKIVSTSDKKLYRDPLSEVSRVKLIQARLFNVIKYS